MNRAVFLDKDGTLIPDIPYNIDTDKITLEQNSIDGLRQLQKHNYLIIVVSNQSGVALGYFDEVSLENVKDKLQELLLEESIILNGFYYCPHHAEGTVSEYTKVCNCRKPMPGMLMEAAKDWNIDLSLSWMIGDILNDVEAGNTAGCNSILVDNGNETEWLTGLNRHPLYTVKNINEAASQILNHQPHVVG